jgi:MFS family permease
MKSSQLTGRSLTIGIATSCGLGFMLFGYDQGVFGGLLSNPSFLRQFDHPDATIQSQIVSTYTLGCIFGAILTIFTGDWLGRRKSVALGCVFLVVGGTLQATSFTLAHMIVGRIVSGFGIGVNTTTSTCPIELIAS